MMPVILTGIAEKSAMLLTILLMQQKAGNIEHNIAGNIDNNIADKKNSGNLADI